MPLTLTNPIAQGGTTYPYVAVQIIVNPQLENGGWINRAVVNLTPYRTMPNGTVDALVTAAGEAPVIPPVLIADATARAQIDPAIAAAMQGILTGVQQYLALKGI